MKELKRKIEIQYNWWRVHNKPIKTQHIEALEESAEERIRDQIKDGCTSGELVDNIRMTDKDGEDGIEYQGHWEIKKT